MAILIQCNFCGGEAVNHDHDSCAEKFGQELHQQIFDWYARQTHAEHLPTKITDKFSGVLWQSYLAHLKRLSDRQEKARRAEVFGSQIQKTLQELGNETIKKLDPDLEVFVSVKCHTIPRY